MGWRLPTIQELASLVDLTQSNPALPLGNPFSNVQTNYWSATTGAPDTGRTWVVDFENGFPRDTSKTLRARFVWCVRGGQGVDPQ